MEWYVPALLAGFGVTMMVTFGTFALALVAAIPITLMRQSRFRIVRTIAVAYVELFRGIPPLTLVFLAFFALPQAGIRLNPVLAAIVGLGLMATAYVSEIYRGALRAVPNGQWEAAQTVGLGRFQTYRRIIGPQAFRTAVPVLVSYLIGLFKDSTLASTVGAMDITGHAVIITRNELDGLVVFMQAAAIYLTISIPVGLFGRWLTRRMGLTSVSRTRTARLRKRVSA